MIKYARVQTMEDHMPSSPAPKTPPQSSAVGDAIRPFTVNRKAVTNVTNFKKTMNAMLKDLTGDEIIYLLQNGSSPKIVMTEEFFVTIQNTFNKLLFDRIEFKPAAKDQEERIMRTFMDELAKNSSPHDETKD